MYREKVGTYGVVDVPNARSSSFLVGIDQAYAFANCGAQDPDRFMYDGLEEPQRDQVQNDQAQDDKVQDVPFPYIFKYIRYAENEGDRTK